MLQRLFSPFSLHDSRELPSLKNSINSIFESVPECPSCAEALSNCFIVYRHIFSCKSDNNSYRGIVTFIFIFWIKNKPTDILNSNLHFFILRFLALYILLLDIVFRHVYLELIMTIMLYLINNMSG